MQLSAKQEATQWKINGARKRSEHGGFMNTYSGRTGDNRDKMLSDCQGHF